MPPPAIRLTHTQHQKQSPIPAPDGKHVVYTRIMGAYLSLRVLPWEGGEERPLFAAREDYIQQHPCWSRDGKKLAFTVNEGLRNGQIGVHACDTDGLVCSGFRPVITPGQNCQPAWSPDGKQLAYIGLSHQLYVADASGGGRRRLASLAGIQFYPAWSPDGRWIVFAASHEGHFQLYRIHPDGAGLERLTRSDSLDSHPAYSPDGRWLAFTSNRSGDYELFVMPAGGGEARNVSQHPARDDYPAWTPDSRALLFVSTRDGGFDLYRQAVP
jgi:TolB protein